VEEGSTENAAVVTSLITGLRDRGLDTGKPILAVLDGAKALSKAVKDVFGKPVIARCQQHKIRNVTGKLPDKLRSVTEKRMRQAYHAESALKAEAELQALARELDKTHPAPPRRCARVWPRPSPSCGSKCRPPWPERSGPRTRSSR
jgi:putative transposase